MGEHAREVDDAPAAGRQLASELVPEVGDAEELEQLLDPFPGVRFRVGHERQVQRGAHRVLHLEVTFERERHGLLDRE